MLITFLLGGKALVGDPRHHSIYPVFDAAGRNWLAAADLYTRGKADEFRYSPLVAAFFVPFHMLPSCIGFFIWTLLNAGVYLGGLWACCAADIPRSLIADQRAALFLLIIPLSIGSLNNAQSNPLVIGLLLLAIAKVVTEQWWIAAACVVVASLFKLYPVSLGLLLIAFYPRQFTGRFVLLLAIGLLLPFVLQHPQYVLHEYEVWFSYLRSEDRQRDPIWNWYRDFRAVWRVYVHSMTLPVYQAIEVLSGGVIAVVSLAASRAGWPRGRVLGLVLSLSCGWMTALGPATESATYILLAPPLAWAILDADADERPAGSLWRLIYGAVFGLFLVAQGALWIGRPGVWFRDHLQPLPIAGTIFLLATLGRAITEMAIFNEPVVTPPAVRAIPPATDG